MLRDTQNMINRSRLWAAYGILLIASCSPTSHGTRSLHPGDRLNSFSQEITSSTKNFQVNAGGTCALPVTIKNTGTDAWFKTAGPSTVDLSYRWLDRNSLLLPIEGKRTDLQNPVLQPGESESLQLQVVAPPKPGAYILWVSMVQEGIDWFYARGTLPLVLHVTVT